MSVVLGGSGGCRVVGIEVLVMVVGVGVLVVVGIICKAAGLEAVIG